MSTPESLTILIPCLDIIFTLLSTSTIYIPGFYRSWTYHKGFITRRDVRIVLFVILSTIYRQLGLIFSVINLVRDGDRHTLMLRIVLGVVLFPIEMRLSALAWKTWRRTKHRQTSAEVYQGPHQPGPRHGNPKPLPKAQQVLYVSELDIEPFKRTTGTWHSCFWCTCGIHVIVTLPACIITCSIVTTSIALSRTSHNRWAAILIYLLPILTVLSDFYSRNYQASQRGEKPDISKTLRFSKTWLAGTIPGLVIYMIAFAMGWESRRGEVRDMTEFWMQLGEAFGGSGG